MNLKTVSISFCSTILLASLSPVFAAGEQADLDIEIDELLGLSLEELNEVPVYASTKRAESQQTSSASISVYPRQQMLDYGLFTIADLARITPGYSVSSLLDHRGLGTRGFAAQSYENNRHLLLVDGIPVRHARSARMPVQEEMPLFFAEQVEFLRGPSSVIYGSGAMNGVVNVRSRQPTSDRGVEARFSVGSRDAIRHGMANAWFKSGLGTTTMSLGLFDRDASKQAIDAENFPDWRYNNRRDAQFLYLKHDIEQGVAEGLTVGLLFSRLSSGIGEGLSESQTEFLPDNDTEWEYLIPYLKFERVIGDASLFSSYVSYNRSEESGFYQFVPNPFVTGEAFRSRTEAIELQSEVSSKLMPDLDVRIGGNLDLRREQGQPVSFFGRVLSTGEVLLDPGVFPNDSPWFRDVSAFFDVQKYWDFLAGTTLTVGLRYTSIKAEEHAESNVSPRVSLVQQLNDEWTIRFFGGQAFRSANLKEVRYNSGVARMFNLVNELSLEPELITTYELGLGYQKSHFKAQLNLFSNRFEDEIIRVRVQTPIVWPVFINSPRDSTSLGGELIVSAEPRDGLIVSGSYAYNNPNGGNDEFLNQITPRHSANLILNYHTRIFDRPSSLVLINRWQSGFSARSNPEWDVGAQFSTDVAYRMELTPRLTFELRAENLFSRDNRIPTVDNVGTPDQEMTLYGGLGIRLD